MSTARLITGGIATAWKLIIGINDLNAASQAPSSRGTLGPLMAFPEGVLPETIDGFPDNGGMNYAPGANAESRNVIVQGQKAAAVPGTWEVSYANAVDIEEALTLGGLDGVQKLFNDYDKATPTPVSASEPFTETDSKTGEQVPLANNQTND